MFYFCSSCIQIMFKFKPCSHYVQVFGEKFELCSHFVQLLFKFFGGHTGEAKFVQSLFMAEVNQYHSKGCIHQLFKTCSYPNYIQSLFIYYSNSNFFQAVQVLFKAGVKQLEKILNTAPFTLCFTPALNKT